MSLLASHLVPSHNRRRPVLTGQKRSDLEIFRRCWLVVNPSNLPFHFLSNLSMNFVDDHGSKESPTRTRPWLENFRMGWSQCRAGRARPVDPVAIIDRTVSTKIGYNLVWFLAENCVRQARQIWSLRTPFPSSTHHSPVNSLRTMVHLFFMMVV